MRLGTCGHAGDLSHLASQAAAAIEDNAREARDDAAAVPVGSAQERVAELRDEAPRHPVIIDCWRKLALAPIDDRLRVFAENVNTLAGFAAAGLIKRPDASDALIEMARAHGLDARHGSDTIERMIADAFTAAHDEQADRQDGTARAGTGGGGAKTSWRAHAANAEELRRTRFPPVHYVVPGFIPEGVTLLASRPKLGKSWLVLDLCVACAGGRFTLGNIRPVVGDVLYLALEDNARRLQRRLDRLMRGADAWPARLTLATRWRRANEGGLADIEEWCGAVAAPRLIVIDTLEKIRPPGGSGPLYSADYLAISGLHRIASEKGLAIVVVHHDRKADGEDPFDTVSGTLGLVGAADTVLLLKRRPTGTVLYARGRDIEESETAVQFNKAICKWTILGPVAEVHRSNDRARVLEVLAAAGRPLPVKEIQTRADLPSRNAADSLLFRMVEAGEIKRVAKSVYDLADADAPHGPGALQDAKIFDAQEASG